MVAPRRTPEGRCESVKARRACVLAAATLVSCIGATMFAPTAFAHAQLLGSSPESGVTLKRQPAEVVFKFNQPVGGTVGAVRIYDAQGSEVDDLAVSHPNDQQSQIGVGLKPHLPDGTYTATYRVISADTHIVYGGLIFNLGHPGAAPKYTVAGLIGRNESGEVTKLAFGAVRALDYLSIALMVGGLAFLVIAWLPGLAAVAGVEQRWLDASRAFARRLRLLLAVAVVLGIAVSLLGIFLQGASAAGVSLWASLKSPIVDDTLHSRFGQVWGLRAVDWVALGALLAGARALKRPAVRVLRPASATGKAETAFTPPPPRWLTGLVVVGAGYLAMTPALGGHASIQSPVAVFFPSDFLHVLAASAWVGGVACLVLALPAATRQVDGEERSRLLLATLARFSRLALGAVIAIAVTGVVQAYIDVRSLNGLLDTTYGTLVIVKVALLAALIGLGAINRRRVIPALKRIVESARFPGNAGVLARRNLRVELSLMLVVFGVTAALVSYTPPIDAAQGPFSTNTAIGPIELEMTVDPARPGLNTLHLYLINAKDGTQFTGTKQLTVTAALPSRQIGPLPLKPILSGPGHYTVNAALSPAGTWETQITDRVSAFSEYSKTIPVPIR